MVKIIKHQKKDIRTAARKNAEGFVITNNIESEQKAEILSKSLGESLYALIENKI